MRRNTILGGAVVLATTLAFGTATVRAADSGNVDITEEINYDESGTGNESWVVTNVTPGAGVELDGSSTPTVDENIGGSFDVDIDPDTHQITITTVDPDCLDLVKITITGDMIGEVSTVSDTLWNDPPATLAIDNSTPGTVIITWTATGCTSDFDEGSTAVFSYAAPVLDEGPNIPGTGSNTGIVAIVAALTLLAGAALVLTGRRHTRSA